MKRNDLKLIVPFEWIEVIDELQEDFFFDGKIQRWWGEKNYYRLEKELEHITESIPQKILNEQNYRKRLLRVVPHSERDKAYIEGALEDSRVEENRLLFKMERRNTAVGDVDKAREYPIEEIISFKHGFAICLWHTDSHPSLHWFRKGNKAHCFVCNKSYDSIDAARIVWGLNFKEAISKLTKNI